MGEEIVEWFEDQLDRLNRKVDERDREIAALKSRVRDLEEGRDGLREELGNAELRISSLVEEQGALRRRYAHLVPIDAMTVLLHNIRGQVALGFQTWKPLPKKRARQIAWGYFAPAYRMLGKDEQYLEEEEAHGEGEIDG